MTTGPPGATQVTVSPAATVPRKWRRALWDTMSFSCTLTNTRRRGNTRLTGSASPTGIPMESDTSVNT